MRMYGTVVSFKPEKDPEFDYSMLFKDTSNSYLTTYFNKGKIPLDNVNVLKQVEICITNTEDKIVLESIKNV